MNLTILDIENLSVTFSQYYTGLKSVNLNVISDLSLRLEKGEILAIVGASGSGKSILAHAILGILPENARLSGEIYYKSELLTHKRKEALRGKEIVFVPQSVNYLSPLMRVGKQVRTSVKKGDPTIAQRNVFKRYHLEEEVEQLYPFQLSGGMARRILLSTAVVSDAQVLIADEPTPGLDPIVMEEALWNLKELASNGCGVMLITHDINSAIKIADKIAVFYTGTVIEIAPVENFTGDGSLLRHPYSRALWKALPQNEFVPIPGSQPHPSNLPSGCLFAPRCLEASEECLRERPNMQNIRGGMVRCYHAT